MGYQLIVKTHFCRLFGFDTLRVRYSSFLTRPEKTIHVSE